MGSTFMAHSPNIYGTGRLVRQLSEPATGALGLLQAPRAGAGYDGILALIKPGVDAYADAAHRRMLSRANSLSLDGIELQQAAWRYASADRATADELARIHTRHLPGPSARPGDLTSVDELPGAITYPLGITPDVGVPPEREADIAGLIGSTKGVLTDVDKAIRTVTKWAGEHCGQTCGLDSADKDGWSPLEEVIKPLCGNWAELERAGEIFRKAGECAESVAGRLGTSTAEIDHHWDGKAARAYVEHIQQLEGALAWEGPLGRIAERVLKKTSTEIQDAAKTILNKLNEFVQSEVVKKALADVALKIATMLQPGIGWLYNAAKIGSTIRNIYNLSMALYKLYTEISALLDRANKLIKDAKTVLEALENPRDFAEKKAEEKLKPYRDKLEKQEDREQFGRDLGHLANGRGAQSVPAGPHKPATGPGAWENE